MENDNGFDMAQAVSKMVAAETPGMNCVTSKFPPETCDTMAYVPFQLDRTSFSPDEALKNGTLFTVLNKPFIGRSGGDE